MITPCLASGSGLLNTWTKSFDPELMAELGIREEQLSRLVAYDQTFPLTEEAAQALGVQAGGPGDPDQLRRRPESGGAPALWQTE